MSRSSIVEEIDIREWLNDTGYQTTAFVAAQMTRTKDGGVDGWFKIADCDRQISLDVSVYMYASEFKDEEYKARKTAEIQNIINKLKRLEDVTKKIRRMHEKSLRTLEKT